MSELKPLTDEQKARVPEFVKKYRDYQLCTSQELNRKEVMYWIGEAYKKIGATPPKKMYVCRSPQEAAHLIAEKTGETVSAVKHKISWCYGNHEAGWLKHYDYYLNVCGIKDRKSVV